MSRKLTPQQRAEGTGLITAAQGFGRFLLWLAARPTVVGLENVPTSGKVLLAANHTHNFDGPTLFSVIPRPAGFFVKAEAFIGPIGPFLRSIGQIPIKRGVPQPYASHPRLDLFVSDTSPHPMKTFGCTACHEGQGSATSFKWASHSPNSPKQAHEWHDQYGWFNNHHWIFPRTGRSRRGTTFS